MRVPHLAFTQTVTIAKLNRATNILIEDTPNGEQKIRLVLPEGALETTEEGEARFRVDIPTACFKDYASATPIADTHQERVGDEDGLLLELGASRKNCKWIGASAGNDNWCNNNCNHVTPYCPPTHCSCNSVAKPPPPPAPAPARPNSKYSWNFGTVNNEPPIIIRTAPVHRETGVSTALESLVMKWNEQVDSATDGYRSVEMFKKADCPKGFVGEQYGECKPILTQWVRPDSEAQGNHSWAASNTLLTVNIKSFTSSVPLESKTTYFVVLQKGLVFDRANPPNPFAGWKKHSFWQFTTAEIKAPQPVWTYPANNERDVSPRITMLRVQYDMDVEESDSQGKIKLSCEGASDVLFSATPEDAVWSAMKVNNLTPDSPLPPLRPEPSGVGVVNCQGTWDAWAGCGDLCAPLSTAGGSMKRTFTVTSQPKKGGMACPKPLTQTKSCPVILLATVSA